MFLDLQSASVFLLRGATRQQAPRREDMSILLEV
jgi:hypothetical protein